MKIKLISRLLLVLAAILLVSSIFVAIWRIELEAPQYPEGLVLLIYANKLGGNVDIINGLNHYIGMATLHSENFIEFTILPYIIAAFALFSITVSILSSRKLLYSLFVIFLLFGVLSMIDFYRWNYNYGHNLDPNAAIVVPGMAYQPPLIGYKQLLNFGAFSIPDIGGWLFILAGFSILIAVILETKFGSKILSKNKALLSLSLLILTISCGSNYPKPPKLNSTDCDFCKMTIANEKFVAQCITPKNKVYYFDDLACMVRYKAENQMVEGTKYYIALFDNASNYIDLNQGVLIHSDDLKTPMGGNMAAFASQKDAENYKLGESSSKILWSDLIK